MSDDQALSVWLEPAEPLRSALAQQISTLASARGAISFEPHITLYAGSGETSAFQAALEHAAASFRPLELPVRCVSHGAQLFKTLYFQLTVSPALSELQRAVSGPAGEPYSFDPHLSLLYQRLDSETRAQLANGLQPPAAVACDTLALVTADDWEDIAGWRVLQRSRLG